MNRREFIKTGSVGLAALTAGIGTGSILKNVWVENKNFSAFAFLPSDKGLMTDFLRIFQDQIHNYNFINYIEKNDVDKIINKRFSHNSNYGGLFYSKYFEIKLTKLENNINGDIFVSNNSKLVLNPKKDFNQALLDFREIIIKKKSNYLLSIQQRDENLLRNLIYTKNNFITLQNKSGVYDRIDASINYSSVFVPGDIGKTEFKITDGRINIIDSPCRHKLCKIMSVSSSNTIVCVPNKILIKLT